MASNQLQQSTIYAPTAGEYFAFSPSQAPRNAGDLITNVLPGRPGTMRLRGPIRGGSGITIDAGQPGFWERGNSILLDSGTGLSMLSIGSGQIPDFARPANFGARGMTRNRVKFGNLTYGSTYTFAVPGGRAPIFKWNGQSGTANVIIIANGPENVRGICEFASRLMCLAESPPGATFNGANGQKAALYWTDPNWDGTDNLASWQDDVSGLVNKIVLPGGDTWHTLVPFYDTLYILGQEGILTLRGSGPSNWALRKVSAVPCYRTWYTSGPNAIPTDDGLYFLSDRGIQRFDGTKSVVVSDMISWESGRGSRFTFNEIDILGDVLPCEALQISSDILCWTTQHNWCAYHMPTKSWVEFIADQSIFSGSTPLWMGRGTDISQGSLWAADRTSLVDISQIATPEQLIPMAENNQFDQPGSHNLSATVRSKKVDLASIGYKAQLNRVIAPVKLTTVLGTSAQILVQAVDGDTGTVLASASVNGDDIPGWKQVAFSVFGEVNKFQLLWTLFTNGDKYVEFEIHDAVVEYQVTRLRGD